MSKHAKPFECDYAKSNRAKCKGCKDTIIQGTLRLAVMVQSPFFDGKTPKWFHEECTDAGPSTEAEASTSKGKSRKRVNKKAKDEENAKCVNTLNDFSIEYAKSNRSTCRGCEAKIAKGEIRVSKMNYDSDQGKMIGGIPEWYHLSCFNAVRLDLEFSASGKQIPGFGSLEKKDQKIVEATLPSLSDGVSKTDGPGEPKKARMALDDISPEFKKQNEKLFQAQADIKKITKKDLSYLCEVNGLLIPKKVSDIQTLVADHLVCGKLKACPSCKGVGKYEIVPDEGYRCKNELEAVKLKSVKGVGVTCDKILRDVEREPFVIPDEYKEKFPVLEQYGTVEKRIFPRYEPVPTKSEPSTSGVSVKSEPTAGPSSGPKVERFLPLKDMVFYIHISAASGKDAKQKLTASILRLGGDTVSDVRSHVAAAIATKAAVENMEEGGKGARAMEELKEYGIHVVPSKFIKDAANGKVLELIEKMNLAPWGSDINARIGEAKDVKLKSQEKSVFKSKSGTVKLQIKDGLAVDPDSGLADTTELVKYFDDRYLNAVMGKTDVAAGKNSFYKLQVLKSKIHKEKYYLFRAWGRIGTSIGGTKVQDFKDVESAFDEFDRCFEKETGNSWLEDFYPIPGKMKLLDVKYEDTSKSKKVKVEPMDIECSLEKPVAALVELLFDEKAMTATLKEYELDMDRMPLGKLSAKHLAQGYSILNEVISVLDRNAEADVKDRLILTLTNSFYTHIPHSFGLADPPLLDNKQLVVQKMEMIDAMTQIELAYTIKQEGPSAGVHPLVNCYEKLQANIKSVDTSHPHYEIIHKYVQNTHAKTHRQYSLNIETIFEVSRHGEDKRFKPFEKLGNKHLLWHGSRLTNFASIISKGLCIAPPEAPVTGYMFGKGIYFADSVSKSANYCMTNSTNNVGLLLLCEVALGKVVKKTQAEFVTKLPNGFHSVQGQGRNCPDPKGSIVLDNNITVPLGTLIDLPRDQAKNLSLLYNEFIVYDPAQVKIRYILKVRFNYK
ncbi:hypothetical protein M8J77_017860 [Diaphorina citri]|nr:hypothetical protein M8J77_017860 [Diaphorina citri]